VKTFKYKQYSRFVSILLHYLDLALRDFDVILGQRIEARKVLDVAVGKVETGAMPRTRDHSVALKKYNFD
jgi:hypothetical protein